MTNTSCFALSAMTCRDAEGWRAVSRLRDFDTTPCFEEGVLLPSLLACYFLDIHLPVLAPLFRRNQLQRTPKSYTSPYSKIGTCYAYYAILCIPFRQNSRQALLCILRHLESCQPWSRVLALHKQVAVLGFVCLGAPRPVVHVCVHLLQPHAYPTLLDFLAAFLAALHCVTFATLGPHSSHRKRPIPLTRHLFTLKTFHHSFVGSIAYGLECMGSEIGLTADRKNYLKKTPNSFANIYSIWVTFRHLPSLSFSEG
jgi:hypothetical protein